MAISSEIRRFGGSDSTAHRASTRRHLRPGEDRHRQHSQQHARRLNDRDGSPTGQAFSRHRASRTATLPSNASSHGVNSWPEVVKSSHPLNFPITPPGAMLRRWITTWRIRSWLFSGKQLFSDTHLSQRFFRSPSQASHLRRRPRCSNSDGPIRRTISNPTPPATSIHPPAIRPTSPDPNGCVNC